MLKEELIKSIDNLVDEFFAKSEEPKEAVTEQPKEQSGEVVAKSDEISDAKATATDISLEANGGGDVIKNKDLKEEGLENIKEDEEEDEEKEKKKKAKKSIEVDITANSTLLKSLSGLTDIVKSLKSEIEDLKKQPSREPKSLRGYQAINKSEGAEEKKTFKKSEVLDAMYKLQKSNQCQSQHIIEYETSGNITNQEVKQAVKELLQSKKN